MFFIILIRIITRVQTPESELSPKSVQPHGNILKPRDARSRACTFSRINAGTKTLAHIFKACRHFRSFGYL